MSRSGFAADLRAAAGQRNVRLVHLDQLVADLVPGGQPIRPEGSDPGA